MNTSDNHSWVIHSLPAKPFEKDVRVRNASGFADVLPGLQVPPEIRDRQPDVLRE